MQGRGVALWERDCLAGGLRSADGSRMMAASGVVEERERGLRGKVEG